MFLCAMGYIPFCNDSTRAEIPGCDCCERITNTWWDAICACAWSHLSPVVHLRYSEARAKTQLASVPRARATQTTSALNAPETGTGTQDSYSLLGRWWSILSVEAICGISRVKFILWADIEWLVVSKGIINFLLQVPLMSGDSQVPYSESGEPCLFGYWEHGGCMARDISLKRISKYFQIPKSNYNLIYILLT